MRRDRHLLQAQGLTAAAAVGVLLLFVLLAGGMLWGSLAETERRLLADALAPRAVLGVMAALFVVLLAAAAVTPLVRRWVQAPARLLEQAQVLLNTDVQRTLSADGAAAPVQGLASTLNIVAFAVLFAVALAVALAIA